MFRNAFCAAPSCSGSRAALLTGEYCHTNGMMGLAHRGFSLTTTASTSCARCAPPATTRS